MAYTTSFPLSHQLPFPAAHSADRRRFSAANRTGTAASRIAVQKASLYDVLGVQTRATCQEIKSAYRKLARVLHPDVVVSSGREDDVSAAADEFMRVHEAYATLFDTEKRAAYDGSLFRFRRGAAGRGRTWETDQCW